MKRVIAILLVMMSIMSVFVGCEKDLEEENMGDGNKKPGTTTTAKPTEKEEDEDAPIQLTEEQAAYLEECGISLESFYAMDPEQQKMILTELGIVAGDKEDNDDNKDDPQPPKEYTTDDVAGDGKFVVRIGDGLWNNYYLYYEDGVLVKVEASFRKNDLEPEETYLWEGDNLSEFWYYDMTLDELIEFFQEQNYGYTTKITKQ
jgi:hypothetical protein